jgi:hypothetical protein
VTPERFRKHQEAGCNGVRREEARSQLAPWRRDQHHGSKGGGSIGYSGYKHQKGEQVIAITDHHRKMIFNQGFLRYLINKMISIAG